MSTFGQDLIASAHEARARGEAEPAQAFVTPSVDVAAIRKKTDLSQDRLAGRFAFSAAAVCDWEHQRRRPDDAARTLLIVIDRELQAVERALRVA